jgi:hypothetical protein
VPSRLLPAERTRRLQAWRSSFPFVPTGGKDIVEVLDNEVQTDDLLERLAAQQATPRDDLMGGANVAGGSGGQLGRFVELDDEFLKTSLGCRYETLAEALEKDAANEPVRRYLGIYHPQRVWFLSRGADDAFWACSLTPRLETVRERLNRAPSVQSSWDLYLDAFAMTFALARRHNALLDCNPNNFGLDQERLFYIDDDITTASSTAAFATQALLRLREYPQVSLDVRRHFLAGFVGLCEKYTRQELRTWGMLDDLETGIQWPRESELQAILTALKTRLLSTRKRKP